MAHKYCEQLSQRAATEGIILYLPVSCHSHQITVLAPQPCKPNAAPEGLRDSLQEDQKLQQLEKLGPRKAQDYDRNRMERQNLSRAGNKPRCL